MEPGPVNEQGEQICICTDSVHSRTGTCPGKYDRDYYHCPLRKGLFPEVEK